jgi:iron(III) transport system substrate-binding protein
MPAILHTARAADDKLVVYSAAEEKYCKALLEGFARRQPGIAVDFQFGISVDLHERYLAEVQAGDPRADVLWSSAMDLQMSLVHAGEALPYASAEAFALPETAKYRDLAYATTAEPLLTLVNRDCFDLRVPAGSLAELTQALGSDPARFHGRVASYDIARNGLGFLALLYEGQRDIELSAFLRVLGECRSSLFGSNPPLVDEVSSGRAALGYHVLASYALRAVRANPPLAIAISRSPPLAVSRVVFISRRAPHPQAARLFVDYLLSLDGQRALRAAGLFPIREDLAPRTELEADVATMRINTGFGAMLDERRRRDVLNRWRAAVNGQ